MERKSNFKIFCISGAGNGAGKSTMANTVTTEVWSLAGALRQELTTLYPDYNWFDKRQSYKDHTTVAELGNITIRQALINHGQVRCKDDPEYWVRRVADKIEHSLHIACNVGSVAIDDVRKIIELDHLRKRFPGMIIHFHIDVPQAVKEAEFDNEALGRVADYTVSWK